jgi:hypothetical protein
MEWLYNELIPYFADLTGVQVVRPFQNTPAPNGRYCTLKVSSIVNRDFNIPLGTSLTNQTKIRRIFDFTVTINCYGINNQIETAESLAESIFDGLENATKRHLHFTEDISYKRVVQPSTDISAIIGGQYQPRFVLALGFEASKEIVYTESTIETVEIDGNVGGNLTETTITYTY